MIYADFLKMFKNLTDDYIVQIDQVAKDKEKEILEV